jgi:hypothetical protein
MPIWQLVERTKDQPDDVLHLFVRVEDHLTGRSPDIAGGQLQRQLAAASFVQPPLVHALLEHMQLRFAHGAF